MFCSVGRNLLCASIALFLAASPSAVSSEQGRARVVLPARAGMIGIRLQSNQTIYRRGEPIKLRVTLINHTHEQFWMGLSPPWMLCHLSISQRSGQSVRVTLTNSRGVEGGAAGYSLPPGGSVTAIFWPRASDPPEAWTDIRYWGYALSRSGDYTIVGSPTIDALERIGGRLGNGFTVSPTETSNTVHIKILK
jgi:hypothetical protein